MYTYITSLVPKIWEAPNGQLKIQMFATGFNIFQVELETLHMTDSVGFLLMGTHNSKKNETILLGDFFGSLIPGLLYGQYTFGTYLGNKKCVDFFMYYLACKSTVETLMSGCPFGIPRHKQK